MTRLISKRYPIAPDASRVQPQDESDQDEGSANHLDYPASVLASLILDSTKDNDPDCQLKTHIIPPAHGYAFRVKPGQRFRIVDLHGQQVVDLMAWTYPYSRTESTQHSSMSYTRHRLGGSAPPEVGEYIYTNLDEPMLKVIADTVKTHDMLFMACNPSFYKLQGHVNHRNCAENISGAVSEAGFGHVGWNDVVDPFNVFQNTPYYSLKALGCSKPGDFIEFEAHMDCIVGLSCCPYADNGFNGGKITEVAVVYAECQ